MPKRRLSKVFPLGGAKFKQHIRLFPEGLPNYKSRLISTSQLKFEKSKQLQTMPMTQLVKLIPGFTEKQTTLCPGLIAQLRN